MAAPTATLPFANSDSSAADLVRKLGSARRVSMSTLCWEVGAVLEEEEEEGFDLGALVAAIFGRVRWRGFGEFLEGVVIVLIVGEKFV